MVDCGSLLVVCGSLLVDCDRLWWFLVVCDRCLSSNYHYWVGFEWVNFRGGSNKMRHGKKSSRYNEMDGGFS